MRIIGISLSIIATAIMATAIGAEATQSFEPVNPKASKQARQLLDFLYSVQGKYTLAGQHNFISGTERYDSVVHAMTGKYPVVWGSDFSFNATGSNQKSFHHCGPMNLNTPWAELKENNISTEDHRQNLVEVIKQRYAQGRVITLMWHCCFPTEADHCDGSSIWTWADKLPSQQKWDELVSDGTELNSAWKKQMDGIVPYLKQLQKAGIPVLWRPYHEMNGEWFWWCKKPGENGFKKLWIMTYNYLTKDHKLNNLLWVWNTNAPRDIPGDTAGPYADYYPGSDYVDVLAADVYRQDYRSSHHDQLLDLGGGKLITLGEVGQLPTVEQYESQPDWSWFMVWGYFIQSGKDKGADLVKAIYDNPHTITLDEIDFSDKKYKVKTR